MINVIKIPVGLLETNCYLVYDGESRRAVCIDPGNSADKIKKTAGEAGLEIEGILLTHGHFDHIGAVDDVAAGNIPVYIHKEDSEMLTDGEKNASVGFGLAPVTVKTSAVTVEEGQKTELAGLEFEVWHTPGHTKGSVCYRTGDCLFTGDTLFENGYGRTDLYGGSFEDLKKSLRRLFPVRRDYRIFPGHG